jgi:hypothetical protein
MPATNKDGQMLTKPLWILTETHFASLSQFVHGCPSLSVHVAEKWATMGNGRK